jgi:eukaryotic-like serine/threonine-protein kinase
VTTDGLIASESLLDLSGAVFAGRFRVDERIAEGGFAVVYKAWQLALERRVALKVLKARPNHDPSARAEFRERFATEAKTMARLCHPDIVDVYDFSVATLASGELAPWMALEWLDGETLAAQLARRRRAGLRGREPWEALELMRPVLRALAHAHAQGIAHRDIKPANLMVIETPHGPLLRVLDFGIAKIMADSSAPTTGNTRTESSPAFSPAYAAPEQVAFSRTGPWTDVHALGLILTELLTDEAPFSQLDPDVHLFEQVMAARRPTPASKGRDVAVFERVSARALALAPRDRFRDASELLSALESALAGGASITLDTLPATTVEPERRSRATYAFGRLPPRAGLVFAVAALGLLAAASLVYRSIGAAELRPVPEALARSAAPPRSEPPAHSAPAAPAEATIDAVVIRSAVSAVPKAADARRIPKQPASARALRAPLGAGDGRDLFNDTK